MAEISIRLSYRETTIGATYRIWKPDVNLNSACSINELYHCHIRSKCYDSRAKFFPGSKDTVTEKTDSNIKDESRTVSRRDFLKYSGTIVFVLGTGCYATTSIKSKDAKVPVVSSTGIPASDGYLLVDIRK